MYIQFVYVYSFNIDYFKRQSYSSLKKNFKKSFTFIDYDYWKSLTIVEGNDVEKN